MEDKAIGILIDSPIKEVKEYLDQNKLTLGDLTNLKKGLEMQYLRVTSTKDQLLKMLKLEQDSKQVEVLNKRIAPLYIALQLIEDRATVFQSYIGDIKAKKI